MPPSFSTIISNLLQGKTKNPSSPVLFSQEVFFIFYWIFQLWQLFAIQIFCLVLFFIFTILLFIKYTFISYVYITHIIYISLYIILYLFYTHLYLFYFVDNSYPFHCFHYYIIIFFVISLFSLFALDLRGTAAAWTCPRRGPGQAGTTPRQSSTSTAARGAWPRPPSGDAPCSSGDASRPWRGISTGWLIFFPDFDPKSIDFEQFSAKWPK